MNEIAAKNCLLITHFEDEPHRVDLPELIEIALFQHPKFDQSDIISSESLDYYHIKAKSNGEALNIAYVVGLDISGAGLIVERESIENYNKFMYIVDMSINGTMDAGIDIIENIIGSGGNESHIHLLTAYPILARRRCREKDFKIEVISKPANQVKIKDHILSEILIHIGT